MVISVYSRKKILSFTLCLVIFISSISFAFSDKINNAISIENFSLISTATSKITGEFVVSNNNAVETGDMYYVTFLYRDYSLGKIDLINYKVNPLKLGAHEMRKINFSHEIGFEIPQGSYSIITKVFNADGELLAMAFENIGILEGNAAFLQMNATDSYYLISGKRVNLMDGPIFRKGETPTLKTSFINPTTDTINAKVKIIIYNRTMFYEKKPIISNVLPNQISLEPGKSAQVDVALPAMWDSGNYYANIVLVDENNLTVSGVIEAKFNVAGANARIISSVVVYDSGNLIMRGSVLASGSDKTIDGANVNVEVFDENENSIYKADKSMDIDNSVQAFVFQNEMAVYANVLKAVFKIDYNGSMLDLAIVNYTVNESYVPPVVESTPIPTTKPAPKPTPKPTAKPTATPKPTLEPTISPTIAPTVTPTIEPTVIPTIEPTVTPTIEPIPTDTNTSKDGWVEESFIISATVPTPMPTAKPTAMPTAKPTEKSTAKSLPRQTPNPSVLLDVKGTVFERPVFELYKLGIVKGHENNKYYPTGKLSRAEFLVMTLKLLNNGEELVPDNSGCPFVDVDPSYWAYGYLEQGYNSGLFKGYPRGLFKPDASVSYAEVLTVCGNILSTVEQRNEMKKWPEDIVNYAKSKNLSKGMIYNYFEKVSRGNVAQILYDLHKLIKASQ